MFGFNLWQIVIATIAFPVFAIIGTFQLRQFEQRDFQSQNVNIQRIDQRQLNAVRDLRGTWQGIASLKSNGIVHGQQCYSNYHMRLVIDTQTDTSIAGTESYAHQPPFAECTLTAADPTWTNPTPFNANLSGSRITSINLPFFSATLEPLSGSFTSDTITINPPSHRAAGDGEFIWWLDAPINLLRQ